MRLQQLCDGIIDDVDGALACALVDLETGLPLASSLAPGGLLNSTYIEDIAAVTADYLTGKAIGRLAAAMSAESESNFVWEIQTTTEDSHHFMSVVPGRNDAFMVLITDKSTNLGRGWISMREALARIRDNEEGVAGPETQPDAIAPSPQAPANGQDVQRLNTAWRGGRGYRRVPR